MLDESVLGLKKAFRDRSDYDVVTCLERGHPRGTPDEVLVADAVTSDRFFLTNDFKSVTEVKFPPCTHRGILRLPKNKISHAYVFERIEALQQLQLAHRAVGHFTYLEDDGVKVVTHKETIEREFSDYEEFQNIERN